MTDEQLAELEALAEMATKGAWFIVPYGDGDTFVVHSDDEQRISFDVVKERGKSAADKHQALAGATL